MREWKVMRDEKVWGDRFNSLEDAEDYMNGLVATGHRGNFEVVEMTKEEIQKYYEELE